MIKINIFGELWLSQSVINSYTSLGNTTQYLIPNTQSVREILVMDKLHFMLTPQSELPSISLIQVLSNIYLCSMVALSSFKVLKMVSVNIKIGILLQPKKKVRHIITVLTSAER